MDVKRFFGSAHSTISELGVSPVFHELLVLATQRERCKHQEFLTLAAKVIAGGSGMGEQFLAAIWLRDWEQKRWVLDVCETDAGPLSGSTSGLMSLAVDEPVWDVGADPIKTCRIACESSLQLHVHIPERDVPTVVESFPFFYSEREDAPPDQPEDLRGFLQIWTSRPLMAAERELYGWLARFIAVGLRRHRRYRELQALRSLQEVFTQDGEKNVEQWLRAAAEALGKATKAEHCLIFMPGPDEKLQAQVVWSLRNGQFHSNPETFIAGRKSAVRRLYESRCKVVRIADFTDEQERDKSLGTADFDVDLARRIDALVGKQKAWMAAPIPTHDQALGVVVLQSKSCNIPQQFSATDERILNVVRSYLGNVLSSALAGQLMDATLNAPPTPLLHRDLMSAVPEQDQTVAHRRESLRGQAEMQQIFSTLQRNVPNVSGAALWIKGMLEGEQARIEHFGGDDFLAEESSHLEVADAEVHEGFRGGRKVRYVVLKVPDLAHLDAHLGVTLHQGHVGKHELKMLHLWVKTSLTYQLRARETIEEQLKQVNELRHNIRGGIHGIQHLSTALNLFTFVQQQGYTPPRMVLQQAFKSVRRAWFYTEQTRLLVEASRFLISNRLTRNDLKLTKGHIGDVAREVINSVRIEAERFRVIIDLSDRIPKNEHIEFDREGIYILFFNLIENAVKYSVEGEHVRVHLSLQERRWHLVVENIGPELDEKARQDIFKPFVRRFSAPGRKARAGTGLGLPTCRLIVQAHEGDISVSSTRIQLTKKSLFTDKQMAVNSFDVSAQRWFAL